MTVGITTSGVLAVLLAIALAGCSEGEASRMAGHAHAATEAGDAAGLSLYQLESEWQDQHGAARRLSSLGGRVQVVAMVYTSCAYACPLILMDLKRIEAGLPADADVGYVLISIDPERDTPARLARFAEGTRLDPATWTLLTAPDGNVLELAVLLGVRYRREPGGEFSHTNVIIVLDRQGVIRHRQPGLGADPGGTTAAIIGLLDPETSNERDDA